MIRLAPLDIRGVTISNKVLHDEDGDWEMMMEETMDKLKLAPPEANDFFTCAISLPAASAPSLRPSRRRRKKGKGNGKGQTLIQVPTCARVQDPASPLRREI